MATEHAELAGQASMALPTALALIGGLGVACQWLAWRLQLPAVALLAAAGLAVGPGLGVLDPSAVFDVYLQPLVAVAVAIILFEGGLALQFKRLRAAKPVRRLVFVGGPVAWVLGALAAHYGAGLSWQSAAVLGAILVVTGPTVIAPLLRHARLGGKAGQTLQWEGIVNDPIGALFAVAAVAVIEAPLEGARWPLELMRIGVIAAGGGLVGFAIGWGLAHMFRRGLAPEYLKAPAVLAAIIVGFAIGEWLGHEIGLVVVTVTGITLANLQIASWRQLLHFKENIVLLLVSAVFIMLTASLTREVIGQTFNWRTGVFLALMLLVVRPLSVLASTYASGLSVRETALVGWIAPRGIVAVAIAGFFGEELRALGVADAERLAPLAFALSFTTVIVHGFTIAPVAKALKLVHTGPRGVLISGANSWSIALAKALDSQGVPVTIADSSFKQLRPARDAGLDTFYGELLSEEDGHGLDHARFGELLALDANDARNALVCSHFAPEFSRHHIHQLSETGDEDSEARALGLAIRGRTMMRRGRTYASLLRDLNAGWSFQAVKLTGEYGLDDALRDWEGADVVAELSGAKALSFPGPHREPRGDEGSTVILFVPPVDA